MNDYRRAKSILSSCQKPRTNSMHKPNSDIKSISMKRIMFKKTEKRKHKKQLNPVINKYFEPISTARETANISDLCSDSGSVSTYSEL